MRTILVDVDALYVLAIDIAAKVWPSVYNEAFLALLSGKICERSPEQTGADNQIIVLFHFYIVFFKTGICFIAKTDSTQTEYIKTNFNII